MSDKNLVCGVGLNDRDRKLPLKEDYLSLMTWRGMIARCYSEAIHDRQPHYTGCVVCVDWQTFSNFNKWFRANYVTGYELDKDILIEGNKVYSPETCRFVPKHINLIAKSPRPNNSGYPGVHLVKGKYKTSVVYMGETILCKTYDTAFEAFENYAKTKKRVIKECAIESFLANEIKSDIAIALINRDISIHQALK